MERHSEYRNGMMRKSSKKYLHFVLYHPRLVCRIMASMNAVFFMAFSTILLCNLWYTVNHQHQPSSTSKTSNDDATFGLDSIIPVGLMYKNEGKVITKSLTNLSFTGTLCIVNIRLVMATFNRNLYSIYIWLLVHTTHMLYSLSINLWFGMSKGYNSLICLALFNTMLYLLFISIVALFWLEERRIIRLQMRAFDKAASSQERMVKVII
ncbi:PREDICTED: uncharacterized protein LOC107168360 [Diuraphis noxia]|uniref:uncharacterized protein LOC107168360 n=1 Tax=Diuraphis noxia TaxID=143948 RepID=UPI00076397E2|nr:PREDICTED: uncharacterized protein LOC107168360 [Diuraphis noxia]